MSAPTSRSRSHSDSFVSGNETAVESSSDETPAPNEQSTPASPPVMKTKTKKSEQPEAYKALADLMENNTQITKLDISNYSLTEKGVKYKEIINTQCSLNAQKIPIENNIAGALELLTQETSVTDVNRLIAEKLFVLDKVEKLNHINLIKSPYSVINQYA